MGGVKSGKEELRRGDVARREGSGAGLEDKQQETVPQEFTTISCETAARLARTSPGRWQFPRSFKHVRALTNLLLT